SSAVRCPPGRRRRAWVTNPPSATIRKPSCSSAGAGTIREAAANRTPRRGRSTPSAAAGRSSTPMTRRRASAAASRTSSTLRGRFVRFASFSGSHGWQWSREIALKNTSVWTYDLATNTWRDMRPLPEPRTSPLRCAAYDTDNEVIVVFGGEGNSEGTVVYDPYTNTWTRMQPPNQPAFRSGGNMAYDSAHKQFILFGSQFT